MDKTPFLHHHRSLCGAMSQTEILGQNIGLLILRLSIGGLMLVHGLPKLHLLLYSNGHSWMDPLGMGGTLSLVLCSFAEVVCSLALMIGLLTRTAAFILVINFWVVVFIVHADGGWQAAELPMLYLLCYATLLCSGAGSISIDAVLKKHFKRRYYSPSAGTQEEALRSQ